MANKEFLLVCYLSFFFLSQFCGAEDEDKQVYIVYMGSLPELMDYSPASEHLSLLEQAVGSSDAEDSLVMSFKRSFNGFAAKLTVAEKEKLASMGEVVSVFPSITYHLQTTRSWDYMGLTDNAKRQPVVESDTIIGLIDSGIWPEVESFDDKGFSVAPTKWKGTCKGGANFTCNNKIIGARFYTSRSARDEEGHGTHTSSTAAGNRVIGTNFYGLANGTAKGGVPSARIAVYKVCDTNGCSSESILAAFDDAIADGVDLLSISVGGTEAVQFSSDAIAIGSFHAMAKGVLTLHSAGNSGPTPSTTSSVAPWVLTVAASGTDRLFIDKVVLGNEKTIIGNSINTFSMNGTKYPLVYGASASTNACSLRLSQECGCLDRQKVTGKIVLCNTNLRDVPSARSLGAVGIIVIRKFANVSFITPFPTSAISWKDFESVVTYLQSETNPTAEILKSETIKDEVAPIVAPFSSRGPNALAKDILKPDLTAPGVNILAAYSPFTGLDKGENSRHVKYNVLSGTSMSCPHVAGVAAYVKTFHPDWSPSAIKSALMTTSWPMDASSHPDAEFAYGSGHVDPIKAVNPGLVYDAVEDDYIKFLCNSGYTDIMIGRISGNSSTSCGKPSNTSSLANDLNYPNDINYPTMSFKVTNAGPVNVVFHRTVTNVGNSNAIYKVKITGNDKLKVVVKPRVLAFKTLNVKSSFDVTVSGDLPSNTYVSMSLEWSDGTHKVRSPIVLYRD